MILVLSNFISGQPFDFVIILLNSPIFVLFWLGRSVDSLIVYLKSTDLSNYVLVRMSCVYLIVSSSMQFAGQYWSFKPVGHESLDYIIKNPFWIREEKP